VAAAAASRNAIIRPVLFALAGLPPNPTISTSADLFQEEAERARRFAATMTDQKIIAQLNQIAALYEELAADQHLGRNDRE
jgi:hypothetical protein